MLCSSPFISRCSRSIHFPAVRQEIKHFSYSTISPISAYHTIRHKSNPIPQIHLILRLLKLFLTVIFILKPFVISPLPLPMWNFNRSLWSCVRPLVEILKDAQSYEAAHSVLTPPKAWRGAALTGILRSSQPPYSCWLSSSQVGPRGSSALLCCKITTL